MSAADEGRTEKATSKQRDKFRSEGSVAKSQELNSLFTFVAGYAMMLAMGGAIMSQTGEVMRYTFTEAFRHDVIGNLNEFTFFYGRWFFMLITPLLAGLAVGVLVVNLMQFGFLISWKAIKPKPSKINPFTNFKKVLFSMNSIIELLKSIFKLFVLTPLILIAIWPLTTEFAMLNQFNPFQIGIITWQYASTIWLVIIAFMVVLGLGDFVWQKRQLEEKMMMKPQDVKDEHRQAEGDQRVKGELRRRGMRMLNDLIQRQTQNADVIITNPTHFAVALKYTHGQMNAPKVVAKGVDFLALRMRKLARQNEIPIVENRSLARALYYNTDIDQEIPERLFRPVAEILAFLHRLNKERAAHG